MAMFAASPVSVHRSISFARSSTLREFQRGPRLASCLLGGIPRFDALNEDAARRFVNLIDELYDRHVNLVCTAADAPTALYTGTRLQGAFERTASRLIEMQSAEYLATPHKA